MLAVRLRWREELLSDDAIELSGCTGVEHADALVASSDVRVGEIDGIDCLCSSTGSA